MTHILQDRADRNRALEAHFAEGHSLLAADDFANIMIPFPRPTMRAFVSLDLPPIPTSSPIFGSGSRPVYTAMVKADPGLKTMVDDGPLGPVGNRCIVRASGHCLSVASRQLRREW
jgi:hypothetical protein